MKRFVLFLGVFALMASCTTGDAPVGPLDGLPGSVSFSISGNEQWGRAGEELVDPVVVEVTEVKNGKSKPVANYLVDFVVTKGGGSTWVGSALTAEDGKATNYWTLGNEGCAPVEACPNELEVRGVDQVTGEKLTFATFSASTLAEVIGLCDDTYADAISDAHHVVLHGRQSGEFYLWTPDNPHCDSPIDRPLYANGVNSAGTIAGVTGTQGVVSSWTPATWTAGSGWNSLSLPAGGYSYGWANDINDPGQVVGVAWTDASHSAVLWTANGEPVVLPTPSGATSSEAAAVNTSGQVVGYADFTGAGFHPVLWEPSGTGNDYVATTLPYYSGSGPTYAVDINDQGQIIFTSYLGTSAEPIWMSWLKNPGESWTALGTYSVGCYPQAESINNDGEIVGALREATADACGGVRGFSWTQDGGFKALPALVSDAYAWRINNSGEILGQDNGAKKAVVWHPAWQGSGD